MGHTWLLDEQAFAGVEHLDRELVAAYDREQGTAPDEAAVEAHGAGVRRGGGAAEGPHQRERTDAEPAEVGDSCCRSSRRGVAESDHGVLEHELSS
jgi:hypothetical protein